MKAKLIIEMPTKCADCALVLRSYHYGMVYHCGANRRHQPVDGEEMSPFCPLVVEEVEDGNS
jgi:hypothetical protein